MKARNAPLSSLEDRVTWLLMHKEFLKEPLNKRMLVLAMKKDGLISKSTFWSDINLEKAIKQAKLREWAK